MFVGIGIGINRQLFSGTFSGSYNTRVLQDGGVIEGLSYLDTLDPLIKSANWLLIPVGYKESKVYAETPSNGNGDLTWTRASDAWRTDSTGISQRTPWNLLQYSEQFDNAYWSKRSITITANQTSSPNNTVTADLMDEGAVNDTHRLLGSITSINNNANYTISIYVKKISMRYFRLSINDVNSASIWCAAQYDLDTSTYTYGLGSGGNSAFVSANIQQLGNGWFRLNLVCNINVNSVYPIFFASDGSPIVNTDGRGGNIYIGTNKQLYIWGAQLVEGTLPQNYLPTTDRNNVPRIDYSQGTACMLLEPQRTNLALNSQSFNAASWSKFNITITDNNTIAPDGTITAAKAVPTTLNGYFYTTFNAAANSTYTYSVYVKTASAGATTTISLLDDTGTVIKGTTTFTTTGTWQRVSVSALYSTAINFAIAIIGGNNSFSTGEDMYLWGAQLELGAYPTTYIPTTSASVTRLLDTFTRNNLYTNNIVSPAGGTWFVEIRNNIPYIRDIFSQSLILSDASGANLLELRFGTGASRLFIGKVVASTETLLASAIATDNFKIAFKWNGTTLDVFVNGAKTVISSAFTGLLLENLNATGQSAPIFIQAMALYNTPLSDAQCISLTT